MTNPYAPPLASVRDIAEPHATAVPADRSTRLAATILDTIVFALMVYLPLMVGAFLAAPALDPAADTTILDTTVVDDGPDTMMAILVVLTLVGFGAWLWLTLKYMKRNGQSIGKKILDIKVVRTDGSPVELGRYVWLRNVVNALISIIPLYGIIDVLFIFGESRQCLHDKLADTIVVKA